MVMDKSRTASSNTTSINVRRTSSIALPIASSSTLFRKDVHLNSHPLKGREIVLDVENRKQFEALRSDIRKLGGTIVENVSDEKLPFVVVSDHPSARRLELLKVGSNLDSAHLRSIPLLLKDAVRNRVKIRSYATFQSHLVRVKSRIKSTKLFTNAPNKTSKSADTVRNLQAPYIKFEDDSGLFAPFYKEFSVSSNYKPIYVGKYFGQSMFHKASTEQQQRREREKNNVLTPQVPRPPKINRTPKSGFCEICSKQCDSLRAHYASREHISLVNRPGFYDEVDSLLGSSVDYIHVCLTSFLSYYAALNYLISVSAQIYQSSTALLPVHNLLLFKRTINTAKVIGGGNSS
uniref:DBF4-type domain-containing protein n=1 Tax=Heterorhabditis bacteriophora TaxID=37862 RepID=A0A1I7XL49_HETBA